MDKRKEKKSIQEHFVLTHFKYAGHFGHLKLNFCNRYFKINQNLIYLFDNCVFNVSATMLLYCSMCAYMHFFYML